MTNECPFNGDHFSPAARAACEVCNPMQRGIVEQELPTKKPTSGDTAEFKNFHRLLCERFGYTHDEKDWRRDQLSLIEHIAKWRALRSKK